jgi:hypothetical protein
MGDNPTDITAIQSVSSTLTKALIPQTNTNPTLVIKTGSGEHIHEKAYYKGYRDFLHGRLDCPYRKDSLVAKEWQRGQNAAYFKNYEKLKNGSLMRTFYKKKSQAKKPVRANP